MFCVIRALVYERKAWLLEARLRAWQIRGWGTASNYSFKEAMHCFLGRRGVFCLGILFFSFFGGRANHMLSENGSLVARSDQQGLRLCGSSQSVLLRKSSLLFYYLFRQSGSKEETFCCQPFASKCGTFKCWERDFPSLPFRMKERMLLFPPALNSPYGGKGTKE